MDQGVEHSFNPSKTIVHSVIWPKSYIGRFLFVVPFYVGEARRVSHPGRLPEAQVTPHSTQQDSAA
jgi:hypothetical protein